MLRGDPRGPPADRGPAAGGAFGARGRPPVRRRGSSSRVGRLAVVPTEPLASTLAERGARDRGRSPGPRPEPRRTSARGCGRSSTASPACGHGDTPAWTCGSSASTPARSTDTCGRWGPSPTAKHGVGRGAPARRMAGTPLDCRRRRRPNARGGADARRTRDPFLSYAPSDRRSDGTDAGARAAASAPPPPPQEPGRARVGALGRGVSSCELSAGSTPWPSTRPRRRASSRSGRTRETARADASHVAAAPSRRGSPIPASLSSSTTPRRSCRACSSACVTSRIAGLLGRRSARRSAARSPRTRPRRVLASWRLRDRGRAGGRVLRVGPVGIGRHTSLERARAGRERGRRTPRALDPPAAPLVTQDATTTTSRESMKSATRAWHRSNSASDRNLAPIPALRWLPPAWLPTSLAREAADFVPRLRRARRSG